MLSPGPRGGGTSLAFAGTPHGCPRCSHHVPAAGCTQAPRRVLFIPTSQKPPPQAWATLPRGRRTEDITGTRPGSGRSPPLPRCLRSFWSALQDTGASPCQCRARASPSDAAGPPVLPSSSSSLESLLCWARDPGTSPWARVRDEPRRRQRWPQLLADPLPRFLPGVAPRSLSRPDISCENKRSRLPAWRRRCVRLLRQSHRRGVGSRRL